MSHLSWGMVVLASGLICGQTGAQPQDTSLPERAVALPVLQNPGSAQAQPSRQPANPTVQPQPKLPSATTQPPPDQALSSLTAPSDSLSQAPTSGAEASAGFNPHMMGDQFGVFAIRNILVPSLRTTTVIQTNIQTTQTTVPFQTVVTVQQGQPIMVLDPDTGKFFVTPAPFTIQVPVSVPQTNTQTTTTQVPITTVSKVIVPTTVRIPVSSTGAFKIGENESPRPEDRAFFTYNFYSDVTGPFSGLNVPRTDTIMTTINGSPATISTLIPGITPQVDVHREVFGFEKTFLDGYASIGLRAPVVEQPGGGDFGMSDFGDLTVVSKFALWLDRASGDVFSVGLVVTAPTGPSINTFAGDIHSTLLQPYLGFAFARGGFYVQGFSSVVIPTDSQDVALFFNDLGTGYQAYCGTTDKFISSIGPAIEVHVTTPVNHRDVSAPIQVPDLVVLTQGVHVGFYNNSTLTLGLAEPVTGPRPFDLEAFAQFNLRF